MCRLLPATDLCQWPQPLQSALNNNLKVDLMSSSGHPEKVGSFDTDFNAQVYDDHNYGTLWAADKRVAAFIIATITKRLNGRVGELESLYEIGNGGVMRTAALGEPLLHPAASVTLTDVGEPQLAAIRSTVASVKAGNLGYWDTHQAAMGLRDKRWDQAITRLCSREVEVKYHDINKEPVPTAQVRAEGHVLCSHTDQPEDYWRAVKNFYASMEPNDIAIRIFDVGSTGYVVDGYRFNGHPIHEAAIRAEADRLGLIVLGVREVSVDTSVTNTTTASTLTGIGGAVLLKPFP